MTTPSVSKHRVLLIAFVFFNSIVSMFSQAGGAAVPFLLISPDARAGGMGETGTAIADNINAIHWNPAGLAYQETRQVSLAFSRWLPQFNADLYYSYGTIGQYFESMDGTLAFNFILMNLGEFTRTDITGRQLGKFRSNEFTMGISYGTMIAEDLAAGMQLRFVQSNLAPITTGQQNPGTGRSGGFDFGMLWKPQNLDFMGIDLEDNLALGFNLQNVGPKVTYQQEADPMPTMLRMGVAYTLVRDEFNDLKVTSDVAKLLVRRDAAGSDPVPISLYTAWKIPGVEVSAGMEYWYEKVVALRVGYFGEPSRLGNRQFVTFGAGVKYEIFQADFSFINTIEENHPLANTMRFSLLVNWE